MSSHQQRNDGRRDHSLDKGMVQGPWLTLRGYIYSSNMSTGEEHSIISNGIYQVIKNPTGIYKSRPYIYIGKSEKGMYLASLKTDYCLSIWVLNESCGEFKWVLKHQNNLKPLLLCLNHSKQMVNHRLEIISNGILMMIITL
uniref:Uncharacterized protein n=1 Tax=Oryza meridionalis TaxID=40149 RepID=A0A0E0D433_9ORYZ